MHSVGHPEPIKNFDSYFCETIPLHQLYTCSIKLNNNTSNINKLMARHRFGYALPSHLNAVKATKLLYR